MINKSKKYNNLIGGLAQFIHNLGVNCIHVLTHPLTGTGSLFVGHPIYGKVSFRYYVKEVKDNSRAFLLQPVMRIAMLYLFGELRHHVQLIQKMLTDSTIHTPSNDPAGRFN